MSAETLKQFFLSKIEPICFEKLISDVLLRHGFIDIMPTGGVNDRGIDAKLFTFQHNDKDWIVQISTEQNIKNKINKTLQRLKTLPTQPLGLVYATNQKVSNSQREILEPLVSSNGILLKIIDSEWVCARTEITEDIELRPLRLTFDLEDNEIINIAIPQLLNILIQEATSSVGKMSSHETVFASQSLAAGINSFQLRYFGKPIQALGQSDRCYKLAKRTHSLALHLFASHLHGEALKGVKNLSKAKLNFLEYANHAERRGNEYIKAVGKTNLAEVSEDIEIRLGLSIDSRRTYEKNDHSREYANSVGQQSKIALARGDIPSAIALANESKNLSLAGGILNARGIAKAELHVAKAKFLANQYSECIGILNNVEKQARAIKDIKTASQAQLLIIECSIKLNLSKEDINRRLNLAFSDCFELAEHSGLKKLQQLLSLSKNSN